MLRALLLDLDDTLIDDRSAMAAGVLAFRGARGLGAHLPDAVVQERWDTIGRRLWADGSAGKTSLQAQRRQRLRRTFGLTLSDEAADNLFDEYLTHYERHWRLLEGTPAFLAATAHYLRAVVTNGRRAQVERKLQRLGLERALPIVVTPEDCGHRKPNPGIFLHALQALGVGPHEAMMIGDNPEADIAPARQLGLQTYHVCAAEGRTIGLAAGLL